MMRWAGSDELPATIHDYHTLHVYVLVRMGVCHVGKVASPRLHQEATNSSCLNRQADNLDAAPETRPRQKGQQVFSEAS